MDPPRRLVAAALATGGLFLAIQVGALALAEPFVGAGYQAVEDPSDPTNSLIYLAVILIATGVILLVIKLEATWLLRVVVIGMSALLSVYVFSVVVPPVVAGGVNVLPWVLAAGLAAALYVYPEWYVIDATGVIIGAGGAGLFGISFGPLPAIILLSVLAVYDAISVYRTEHMLTLAESVTDLRLPLLLVIPLSPSYSFLAADSPGAAGGDAGDNLGGSDGGTDGDADADGPGALSRDAFFVGLGDTVMPTIMVASAAVFVPAPTVAVPGLVLNLPALAAMVGTMVGLAGLLSLVAKGRAHAGLPLLNGGAIGGYLVGAIASGIPLVEALGVAPYL